MDTDVFSLEKFFHGTATIGERGQVVIPADARKECDVHPGDKLLVFRHPVQTGVLILAKVGKMQEILQQMSRAFEELEKSAEAKSEEE